MDSLGYIRQGAIDVENYNFFSHRFAPTTIYNVSYAEHPEGWISTPALLEKTFGAVFQFTC